jgi:hypothetical protein
MEAFKIVVFELGQDPKGTNILNNVSNFMFTIIDFLARAKLKVTMPPLPEKKRQNLD